MRDVDGWNYLHPQGEVGDGRKICTITQGGFEWVGIRFWQPLNKRWVNNGEPVPGEVIKAWRELPQPAKGWWNRGLLAGVELEDVEEG